MNDNLLRESNSKREYIPLKYSDLETVIPPNMDQLNINNSIEKESGHKVINNLFLQNSLLPNPSSDYHNTVYYYPESKNKMDLSIIATVQGPTLYSNVHHRANNATKYQNSPPKCEKKPMGETPISPHTKYSNYVGKNFIPNYDRNLSNIENYRLNLENQNILANKVYANKFQPETTVKKQVYHQNNNTTAISQKIPTKTSQKTQRGKLAISPYDWQTVNNSKKLLPQANYNTIDKIELVSTSSSDLINTSLDSNKSNFPEKMLLLNKFLDKNTSVTTTIKNSNKQISAELNLTNEPLGANIGHIYLPNSPHNKKKFSKFSKTKIPTEHNLTNEPLGVNIVHSLGSTNITITYHHRGNKTQIK
jgi:hypothetical protein